MSEQAKKKNKKLQNQNSENSDNKEEVFMTQPKNKNKKVMILDPEEKAKEEEEIQKQNVLLKEIKECEEKLKFEKEQREKIVSMKKLEIEKKDKTIKQMKATNEQLEKELEILQTQVLENLDNMEYKEKNEQYENEKKKRLEPLKRNLKVKEKELSVIVQVNNKYKKEKENLQKELERKVNIENINKITDQIKIAQEKIIELENEKKYLLKLKGEHDKCEEEKNKIQSEIDRVKANLDEIRQQNEKKSKTERNNLSLKIKKINFNLTEKQIKEKNEQNIKKSIDKYWAKNQALLNTSEENQNTQKNVKQKSPINGKKQKLTEYSEGIRNKNMDLNNNELPIIPLFNQNDKKILLGVLPEKELNKYEKRYEYEKKKKDNLIKRQK